MNDSAKLDLILTEVLGIRQEMSIMKDDMAVLKTKVSTLETDVAGLKTEVAGLKTDVANLKTEVSGLKTDVSGLKTDVTNLKTEVADIKSNMVTKADLDYRLHETENMILTEVDRVQEKSNNHYKELTKRLDITNSIVNSMKSEKSTVHILCKSVSNLQRDVEIIKQRLDIVS